MQTTGKLTNLDYVRFHKDNMDDMNTSSAITMGNYSMEETTLLILSNISDNSTEVTTLPPTPDNMGMVRWVCEVWISLPLAILGIIGNLLAFIVLCRQKQRLTTTVLLQALAVADTCILVSSILLRSLRYVGWTEYESIHHYVFLTLYPCVYFFRLADTWFTVMMTIDRYIAVCHPLHAQRLCTMKRTYMNIAIIVLLTLAFSMPRFFEFKPDVKGSRMGYMHTYLAYSPVYTFLYKIALFFLVMYLIPMVVLIVLNIFLVCALRRAYTTRNSMISNGSMHKARGVKFGQKDSRGITIVVATVVTVCVVCNVMSMTAHIIWSIQMCFRSMWYLTATRRYLANVSNVMVTFNCAVNFIIYCLFSRKFRTGFSQTFNCGCMSEINQRIRSGHHVNHSDSSGGMNTMSSSYGLLPLRGSKRKQNMQKMSVQHKISADI